MNTVTLMGTLVNTPVVKHVSDKFSVAELLLDVKRPYTSKKSDTDSDTIPLETYNNNALLAAERLAPGMEIVAFCTISSRPFNDRNSGETKYFTKISASKILPVSEMQYAEVKPTPPSEATRYQQQPPPPQQHFQVSDNDIPF